jgi:hypothetical protein
VLYLISAKGAECAALHFRRQDVSARTSLYHCTAGAGPSTTKVQLFGETRADKNERLMALVRTDLKANRWRARLRVAVDGNPKTKQPGRNQES